MKTLKFQFNYCTIKSPKISDSRESDERFQFNYCTIKRVKAELGAATNDVFQFNYCTIKRHDWPCWLIMLYYFNSTIVRLKDIVAYNKQSGASDFNSTIVRLKAEVWIDQANPLQDFNSTIVRLKGTLITNSAVDL